MESFSELIKNRRSMRKFTSEELTQDEVVTLMKAALMAPTSKRSNSWQFIVVDDKETLKELSHCKEQASQFIADAALAVVVTADPWQAMYGLKMLRSLLSTCSSKPKIWDWEAAGYRCANAIRQPECRRTNLSTDCWISLCSCRCSVSLLSVIRVWSVSLLPKNICNGRKYI